jgi:hypothetical protein
MTKMYFSSSGCQGATSGATGKSYDADRQGFINVTDPVDVKALKAGGYLVAGGMPKVTRYWHCDKCDWDANLNHCPKCDSYKLRRVVK